MQSVAWFLRVVELPAGGWACRRGLEEFDRHPSLEEALSHLWSLAEHLGPVEVIVHGADGTVTRLAGPQPC
jgi:hypothetical protein